MKALEKESFKKRICIILLAVLSMAAVILISLNTKTVFAEDDGEDEGVEYDDSEALKLEMNNVFSILAEQDEELSKIVHVVAPGKLAEELYGSEYGGETIADALLYKAGSPAHKGINITSAISMMILLVYGIIQIVKIAKDEKGSIESWLQLAIIMVLGVLALAYVGPILTFLDKLGLRMFKGISEAIVGKTSTTDVYKEAFKNLWEAARQADVADTANATTGGDTNPIGTAVSEKLFTLISAGILRLKNVYIGWMFKILMYFTFYSILVSVYGLLFELIIRRIFTPIAITGIAVEGIRSPGVRYLKRYFAMYIRLAMYVVIISLCCRASSWALSGYGSKMTMIGTGTLTGSTSGFGAIVRTLLMGGGNLYNNGSIMPFLNMILTITCIRAATKALMSSTAQIAVEVVGDLR